MFIKIKKKLRLKRFINYLKKNYGQYFDSVEVCDFNDFFSRHISISLEGKIKEANEKGKLQEYIVSNYDCPKFIIFKKNNFSNITLTTLFISEGDNYILIPYESISSNSFLNSLKNDIPRKIDAKSQDKLYRFDNNLELVFKRSIFVHPIKDIILKDAFESYNNYCEIRTTRLDFYMSRLYTSKDNYTNIGTLYYKGVLLKKEIINFKEEDPEEYFYSLEIGVWEKKFFYPYFCDMEYFESINITPEFSKEFVDKMNTPEYRGIYEMTQI